MSAKDQSKLDALTALRFVAAFLVVLGHARNDFLCLNNLPDRIVFNQAVTFFFVLSGFILTYVYPTLPDMRKTMSFLVKRFARLWPLHVAVFGMHKILVTKALATIYGTAPLWAVTTANLLMVHAWVPLVQFFFSYNAPSWSISTEFLFYLAFPLLLMAMRRAFWLPLAITAASVLLFISLANGLHLPVTDEARVSVEALLYINPLVRIFEFSIGMVTALAYQKFANDALMAPNGTSVARATLIEIAVLAFTASLMYVSMDVSNTLSAVPWIGAAGGCWLKYSGVPFTGFALTVFVFALGRGLVSRFLSTPLAVLLGDISYAVYLTHYPLLMYRRCFIPQENTTVAFVAFVLILLIISHMFYVFLERPARRGITLVFDTLMNEPKPLSLRNSRWYKAWRTRAQMAVFALKAFGPGKVIKPLLKNALARRVKTAFIWRSMELALLALCIVSLHPCLTRLSEKQAHLLGLQRNSLAKNISVGNGLQLQTILTRNGSRSTNLDIVWKSTQEERLHYYLFVHLLDQNGNKIFEQSANLAPRPAVVKPGDLWLASISIPSDRLNKASQVGLIVVKENEGLMPFGGGNTDMAKLRLLVPARAILAATKRVGVNAM